MYFSSVNKSAFSGEATLAKRRHLIAVLGPFCPFHLRNDELVTDKAKIYGPIPEAIIAYEHAVALSKPSFKQVLGLFQIAGNKEVEKYWRSFALCRIASYYLHQMANKAALMNKTAETMRINPQKEYVDFKTAVLLHSTLLQEIVFEAVSLHKDVLDYASRFMGFIYTSDASDGKKVSIELDVEASGRVFIKSKITRDLPEEIAILDLLTAATESSMDSIALPKKGLLSRFLFFLSNRRP